MLDYRGNERREEEGRRIEEGISEGRKRKMIDSVQEE